MAHTEADTPIRVINAVAPIRICDNGGWTDTWFAGHGKIFNIGVYPYVEVQVAVYPREARSDWVMLHAENYGERFAIEPGDLSYQRHPLLEAAVEESMPPEKYVLDITIHSQVPGGASTGTSAAVSVALIGALDLLTPGRMTPHEVAYAAHCVETERLKLQIEGIAGFRPETVADGPLWQEPALRSSAARSAGLLLGHAVRPRALAAAVCSSNEQSRCSTARKKLGTCCTQTINLTFGFFAWVKRAGDFLQLRLWKLEQEVAFNTSCGAFPDTQTGST
jgi:hypothetical protein